MRTIYLITHRGPSWDGGLAEAGLAWTGLVPVGLALQSFGGTAGWVGFSCCPGEGAQSYLKAVPWGR